MVLIFAIEIACNVLRVVLPAIPFPVYLSSALGLLVALVLVICYTTAAVAIIRFIGPHRKTAVRKMTIRMVISSIGYWICIGSLIAFSISYQEVWGRSMTLNAMFLGLNLAGLMQVLALRPNAPKSGSEDAHSAPLNTNSSNKILETVDSQTGP